MSEKIQAATIGYGFHGRELMTKVIAENPLAQIVGIVDINSQRRRAAEEDGYSAHSSPDELLEKHPGIQYIAMAVNHPQSVRALTDLANTTERLRISKRIAVTIEKPIASYLHQAKEAFDILNSMFLYGGVFNRLEYPSFQYALGQIIAGAIGEITSIKDVIDISLLPPGLDPWVHLPDPKNSTNKRGNALLNGFHSAETMAVLAGLPETIRAHITQQGWYPRMEVDDTVDAQLQYATTAARYHCEWGAIPMLRLATQINGNKGTLIAEEWGNVHTYSLTEPAQTQHFENPEDFAGKHHSGNYNYHDAIIQFLSDAGHHPLPHTVRHALGAGLIAQTIVEMTYLSSTRNGQDVTPTEVIEGIMSIGELQSIAGLAKLPIQKST